MVPQPPQFFGSLVVLEHPVPQHVSPDGHGGAPLQDVAGVQMLATQVSPVGQMVPQPPQLLASVVVLEHPDAQHVSVAVQSGPPLQVAGAWHVPPWQVSPGAHAFPHEPQLFGSVFTFEQPDAQHSFTPVQTGPPLQDAGAVHVAATHVKVAGQVLPQAPQFFGSVSMFLQPVEQHCSMPVQTGPPSQLAGGVQLPCTHVSPVGQMKPHSLQFFGSVWVSVQPSPQQVSTPEHGGPPLQVVVVGMQVAPRHFESGGQTMLQPPQWSGSTVGLTQMGLVVAAQQMSPTGQAHTMFTHMPWLHAPPLHEMPQPPQLFGSVSMFVQRWSSPSLQQVRLPGHAHDTPWQMPPMQPWLSAHMMPQPPQFPVSLLVSTQPWVPQQVSAPPTGRRCTSSRSGRSVDAGLVRAAAVGAAPAVGRRALDVDADVAATGVAERAAGGLAPGGRLANPPDAESALADVPAPSAVARVVRLVEAAAVAAAQPVRARLSAAAGGDAVEVLADVARGALGRDEAADAVARRRVADGLGRRTLRVARAAAGDLHAHVRRRVAGLAGRAGVGFVRQATQTPCGSSQWGWSASSRSRRSRCSGSSARRSCRPRSRRRGTPARSR